jgi:hypothetical protein
MKSKATKIIATRDRLSNDITKYWNIIYVENVVNRNYKRNYDLKELFAQIQSMAEQRAIAKLKALCLNMGFKKFSDLPTDCIQISIFKLSELQEQKIRLGKIRTLDPKMKTAKGKKNLKKTEVLTSDWVKARIKEIDLQIIELKKKIEDFNENTELEEDAPMAIAA